MYIENISSPVDYSTSYLEVDSFSSLGYIEIDNKDRNFVGKSSCHFSFTWTQGYLEVDSKDGNIVSRTAGVGISSQTSHTRQVSETGRIRFSRRQIGSQSASIPLKKDALVNVIIHTEVKQRKARIRNILKS